MPVCFLNHTGGCVLFGGALDLTLLQNWTSGIDTIDLVNIHTVIGATRVCVDWDSLPVYLQNLPSRDCFCWGCLEARNSCRLRACGALCERGIDLFVCNVWDPQSHKEECVQRKIGKVTQHTITCPSLSSAQCQLFLIQTPHWPAQYLYKQIPHLHYRLILHETSQGIQTFILHRENTLGGFDTHPTNSVLFVWKSLSVKSKCFCIRLVISGIFT